MLFSILCGAWFHLLYHQFDMAVLTWQAFIVFDLALVATLIFHEKNYYTRPINVSIYIYILDDGKRIYMNIYSK